MMNVNFLSSTNQNVRFLPCYLNSRAHGEVKMLLYQNGPAASLVPSAELVILLQYLEPADVHSAQLTPLFIEVLM